MTLDWFGIANEDVCIETKEICRWGIYWNMKEGGELVM